MLGGVTDLTSHYTTEPQNKAYAAGKPDQWTRIGDPEINSHSYNHLILEKGVEKHSVEKR
jgi:hypothetical protein